MVLYRKIIVYVLFEIYFIYVVVYIIFDFVYFNFDEFVELLFIMFIFLRSFYFCLFLVKIVIFFVNKKIKIFLCFNKIINKMLIFKKD